MNNLSGIVKMSSFDLWNKLNDFRREDGVNPIKHGDFLARVEDEIDDLGVYENFSHPQNKQQVRFYSLNRDQMLLVGMRESKVVRRKVLSWLKSMSDITPLNTSSPVDQLAFAEIAARMMNLQGSAMLGMIRKVQDNNGIPNMLPDYTVDSPAGNVLGSMVCDSASALLKIHSPKTSAMKFNKMACEAGYLKQESRSSTKHADKVKKYWSVTETGAKFGKNVTSDRNQNETAPRWYSETFLSLVNELLESK